MLSLVCFVGLVPEYLPLFLWKWITLSFILLESILYFSRNVYIFFKIYFWLCWVFIAAHGLSLVVASGGYFSLQCEGFSLRWLLLLQSTGPRLAGSVVVAHRLSYSAACGIFPDQGLNPYPLHWQADS